jgi:hypothetical protein
VILILVPAQVCDFTLHGFLIFLILIILIVKVKHVLGDVYWVEDVRCYLNLILFLLRSVFFVDLNRTCFVIYDVCKCNSSTVKSDC